MFRELVESLLAEGRDVRFTARGLSMAPFIRDGDSVRVRPLGSRLARRGHVVLRRGEYGELILHRVVRITSGLIVTRGDAQTEDYPAPCSRVLGRAVSVAGRRRLHLCFPFGLVLPVPRRVFSRTLTTTRLRRAARRLWEIST